MTRIHAPHFAGIHIQEVLQYNGKDGSLPQTWLKLQLNDEGLAHRTTYQPLCVDTSQIEGEKEKAKFPEGTVQLRILEQDPGLYEFAITRAGSPPPREGFISIATPTHLKTLFTLETLGSKPRIHLSEISGQAGHLAHLLQEVTPQHQGLLKTISPLLETIRATFGKPKLSR